jgi:hypothetical protein
MKTAKPLLAVVLALFATPALADQVTCESIKGAQVECPMNTSGEVRLVRQISKTRCVEGQNWGLFKHSVWVKGGCRASFASSGPGSDRPDAEPDYAPPPPPRQAPPAAAKAPRAAIAACNKFADQGYDGTIETQSAMKPGWWELIIRFEEYRYVCNVSSSGQVESFNKIN